MKESGNSSDVQVVQSSKVFTGLNDFKVVAINPSLEVIKEKINENAKDTAANYTSEDKDGNKRTRLDFYVSAIDGTIKKRKLTFFITDKVWHSDKTGKDQFIDDKGNTAWAPTKEEVTSEYINKKTMRKALMGESQLIDFLKAWMNINTRDKDGFVMLEHPKKLAAGDTSELQEVLKKYKNNTVKLLATARLVDGNTYQDFYKGYFGYSYIKKLDGWKKALNNTFTSLEDNEDLGNFLEYVEYLGSATDIGAGAANVSDSLPPASSESADSLDVDNLI